MKKMFKKNKTLNFFAFLSPVEVVQREQPSVLAAHPAEGTWVHSGGSDLRSRRESFPGHH